jgi:Flp pilus assembly protein TadG
MRAMRERLRTLIASEGGTTALEYGLILPALIMMILGSMDVGRLIWTYTTLHRAVQASARCAAVMPAVCGTAQQVASRAVSEAWGLPVTAGIFSLQTQNCGAQVTASYSFSLLVPWLGAPDEGPPNTISLSVSACYPL